MTLELLSFLHLEGIIDKQELSFYEKQAQDLLVGNTLEIKIPLMTLKDLSPSLKESQYAKAVKYHLQLSITVFDSSSFKLEYSESQVDQYMPEEFCPEKLAQKMGFEYQERYAKHPAYIHRNLKLEIGCHQNLWTIDSNELTYQTHYLEFEKTTLQRPARNSDVDIHSHLLLNNMTNQLLNDWKREASKIFDPISVLLCPSIPYFISNCLGLPDVYYHPHYENWPYSLYFGLVDTFKESTYEFVCSTYILIKSIDFDPNSSLEEVLAYLKEIREITPSINTIFTQIGNIDTACFNEFLDFQDKSLDDYIKAKQSMQLAHDILLDDILKLWQFELGDLVLGAEILAEERPRNHIQNINSDGLPLDNSTVLDDKHFFFQDNENFKFKFLATYEDYYQEGEKMSHCILNHWNKSLLSYLFNIHITYLNKPQGKGYTAEIFWDDIERKYYLVQIVGPRNTTPPKKVIQEIERQICEKNSEINNQNHKASA